MRWDGWGETWDICLNLYLSNIYVQVFLFYNTYLFLIISALYNLILIFEHAVYWTR